MDIIENDFLGLKDGRIGTFLKFCDENKTTLLFRNHLTNMEERVRIFEVEENITSILRKP